MKRLIIPFLALAAVAACQKAPQTNSEEINEFGYLTVSLSQEKPITKADPTPATDDEKAEKKVSVYVFNKRNGRLDAYKDIVSTAAECKFKLTTGEKKVYALINGANLPGRETVTSITELEALVDDISTGTIATNGLTMIGSADVTVTMASEATAAVTVSRLVSRVVINRIVNNLPAQYGKMKFECAYLGNAYSKSTLKGESSVMVNPDGYADAGKTKMIGKAGEQGSCAPYMFKTIGQEVLVGNAMSTPVSLYCQPNPSDTYTTLLIYVTYGGDLDGYYPIKLSKKLLANTTYSLDITCNNPPVSKPDEEFQVNGLNVTITVSDWTTGEQYTVEM